jgi:hypothetical protein
VLYCVHLRSLGQVAEEEGVLVLTTENFDEVIAVSSSSCIFLAI